MVAKKVEDVGGQYPDARAADDAEIHRIRRHARALKTGRLEKNVDAVLRTKGVPLNEAVANPKRRLRR